MQVKKDETKPIIFCILSVTQNLYAPFSFLVRGAVDPVI